jgi:hypothetical protein
MSAHAHSVMSGCTHVKSISSVQVLHILSIFIVANLQTLTNDVESPESVKRHILEFCNALGKAH